MPQPKKGPRLGSNPKHQRLLLSGLALSLFEHESIKTTEAKAKALRPYAERLITKAKKGGLHERRQVLSTIEDRDVVAKLFEEIAPRFSDRSGGYTRILKLGARNGDGAPMALVELVEGEARTQADTEDETSRRRRLRRPARRRTAEGVPETEATTAEAEAGSEAEGRAPEAAVDEETLEEAVEATSDEATGDEPVATPGDADADTSQDEPAESSDEENKGS